MEMKKRLMITLVILLSPLLCALLFILVVTMYDRSEVNKKPGLQPNTMWVSEDGSIELYVSDNWLKSSDGIIMIDGEKTPIEWSNYDRRIDIYQPGSVEIVNEMGYEYLCRVEEEIEIWSCSYKSQKKFVAKVEMGEYHEPGQKITFYRVDEIYMFTQIQECQKTIEIMEEEPYLAKFAMMETPETDRYLKDLEYETFCGWKNSANSMNFDFYAYEFKTPEDAKSYFQNVTGEIADKDKVYGEVAGLRFCHRVVISGNKAYMFRAKKVWCSQIQAYINTGFSEHLHIEDSC